MQEMTQAINAVTTPAVQMWMNWMLFIFACSLFFVWKHPAARFTLGAFVLSAVLGLIIFEYTKAVYLLGISHLLFWLPLAVYLYRKTLKHEDFNARSMFGIWVLLLMATIAISTVFDVRDVALVFLSSR